MGVFSVAMAAVSLPVLLFVAAEAVKHQAIPSDHAVGPLPMGSFARGNTLVGVSESGLEFGGGKFPGVPFKDYVLPSNDSVAYFVGKGMNLFRVPFVVSAWRHSYRCNIPPRALTHALTAPNTDMNRYLSPLRSGSASSQR